MNLNEEKVGIYEGGLIQYVGPWQRYVLYLVSFSRCFSWFLCTDFLIFVHLQTDLCNICVTCKWKIPIYNYGLCRAVFKSSSLTGKKRNETNFIDNFIDMFFPQILFSLD